MPTQNVNLSDQQVQFIRQSIADGRFSNASEVVRAGLRLLEQVEQENKIKLERLKQLVEEGITQIERGDYVEVTKESIPKFIDSIRTTTRRGKA